MYGAKGLSVTSSILLLAILFVGNAFSQANTRLQLPDLIIADVRHDDSFLIVDLQNQGPGAAPKGKRIAVRLFAKSSRKVFDVTRTAPVPEAEFEVTTVRIPFREFRVANIKGLHGEPITLTVDPKNELPEAREGNNEFVRIFLAGEVLPPRGDYGADKGLPDLIVTDVTTSELGFVIHYRNAGEGVTGADFHIESRSPNKTSTETPGGRWKVPAPGASGKTGPVSYNLHRLSNGTQVRIDVTIDPDDRVRESNEANNTFSKTIRVRPVQKPDSP